MTKIKWGLTLTCFTLVLLLGVCAVLMPDQTKGTMDLLFNFTIFNLGAGFLWYILFGTLIMLLLAFSKYGNICLGGTKPQFNKFQLFAMALSAGMGASTMYWGFIEVVYYYLDPQFGITDPGMKMEYASAYNMFHWGPAGWVSYLMCGVPFMISFYLKKNRDMSFSGVINSFFDGKLPYLAQKIIDLLFMITSLAATALTLGLAIPMISSVVSQLTGLRNDITLGIGIIIGLSIIFALSSYVGIEKGIARLSSMTVYICGAMIVIILLVGPTAFLINSTTTAMGLTVAEYLRMSTNTAPYGTTGFPQYWTVFFFANWISYAPGMGIFITKIAKGHKLKDVIIILTGAGFIGTSLIFGICGNFTFSLMNEGIVDATGLIEAGMPDQLVTAVLSSTPFPTLMLGIYLITMILFCVTTLDGTSFSLASVASEKVGEDGNVSPLFRLFWCLLLAIIPIIFLIIKADLNILKSFPVLIIVPMIPIFTILLYKSYSFISKEFGELTDIEIQKITAEE
ncbi:BCCT transporter [Candidatus Epulonipiscium fishelsonii]|uniref:BCCT transporter n=1 Tax=Candidatus Epulonipiscium fishelsonii TaxID=77094 RepID=A0ACC8X7Y0_9FIRM|nr:BCCT transporter [Epulopiscium sp. SCG-B11WGA-EpuloA1]ONI43825.1 BCCT transporter [Epulopiscium sp. SCG-B05WGA-EpuloA1]ONI47500.1 BCCT transporter [Epulopiscium sp. SCG-C06WGA-EpuloA1]